MRKKDLVDDTCVDPTCEESKRDNQDDATNEKENMLTEQDMVGECSYSLTFEVSFYNFLKLLIIAMKSRY